jgi:hypothetical protein
MYEDEHLEMQYEDRFGFEDPADFDHRDFDDEEEFFDECEGHYDDDFALMSGNSIGEPVYCDGSCA